MPGYSQLKKLSEEILKLGNEPKLRADRGEKSIPVEIPSSIPDVDDSDDFVMGMPEKPETVEAAPEEQSDEDFQALLSGETPASKKPAAAASEPEDKGAPAVNLDSILNEIQNGGDVDLSDFDEDPEPEPEKEPPSVADMSLDDLLNTPSEMDETPEDEGIGGSGYSGFGHDDSGKTEEVTHDNFDINSILNDMKASGAASEPSEPEPLEPIEEVKAPEKDISEAENDDLEQLLGMPSATASSKKAEVPVFETPDLSSLPNGGKGILTPDTPLSEIESLETELEKAKEASKPSPEEEKKPKSNDFDFSLDDDNDEKAFAPEKKGDVPSEKESEPVDFSADLADLGDFGNLDGLDDIKEPETVSDDSGETASPENVAPENGEPDLTDLFSADDVVPASDASSENPLPEGSGDETSGDFNLDEIPVTDLNFDDENPSAETSSPVTEDIKPEESKPEDKDIYSAVDDEFAFDGAGIDMNADLPDELREVPPEVSAFESPSKPKDSEDEGSESGENPVVPEGSDISENPEADGTASGDDFTIPDNFDIPDAASGSDPFSTDGLDDFGSSDDGTMPDLGTEGSDSSDSGSGDDFSIPEGFDFPDDSTVAENPGTDGSSDTASESGTSGDFDIPDFSVPEGETDPFSTDGMDSFSTDGMDSFSPSDMGMENPAGDDGSTTDSVTSETDLKDSSDDLAAPEVPVPDEPVTESSFDSDPFSTDGLDSFGDGSSDPFSTDGLDSFGASDGTASGDALDPSVLAGLDAGTMTDGSSGDSGSDKKDETPESSIEDFTVPETDAKLKGEDEGAGSDFDLAGDGDFTIPGFSDTDSDPFAKKEEKPVKLPVADFSGAMEGDGKLNNALTDAQYVVFKKNLSDYPLNLRIAVEDMIVKNEFTDEVVFEVIEKVLKKVTARQLAGHLEKMLDIQIPIPKDFEKRTAAEYEAYKASLQYQLRNRILPVALISLISLMLLLCVGYLGYLFMYRPIMAEKHYKQGYTLLERDEYPQSETEFDEALRYKSKKNWFFKYAEGYRNHKQYDRAEMMYKAILKRYDHDKQAGLEYADMEVTDLANYEQGEQILRREVLDYFVNDQDGILALGDTYLEWATEKDPSKFEDAFQQYSALIQLYGATDVTLSRMLRYNIRTDQLRNVLELKESFYPREKSLSAADWTEMSGYLMDKLFSELPAGQEYLREKIEDVRDMLLLAVKTSPENPVSNYNLSRYFVEVGDHTKSMQSLNTTEKLFAAAPSLKRRDVYKQINTYRLLGEEYLYQREYIKAEETFSDGLDLFEARKRSSGLDGDKNVGLMYGDMGDINYFLSGDLNSAQRNYSAAIENDNDTPTIRYRLGYIDYGKNDYDRALGNFIKATQQTGNDSHLLLALGNTLSLKNDNYAAQGYYERLIAHMDLEREKHGIEVPQVQPEAGDLVETYLKSSNNLGVTLYRLAKQTGSSSLNAKSMVQFQNSMRYWDALTRNQETMVRLPGSNLAEQNLRYVTRPIPDYEPAIYTEIPRMLDGEKGLEQ